MGCAYTAGLYRDVHSPDLLFHSDGSRTRSDTQWGMALTIGAIPCI